DNPESESSPYLTNVIFEGNEAGRGGGMLYGASIAGVSSPILVNVTFINNKATDVNFGNGGGLSNGGAEETIANPLLINVAFINNYSAKDGGGMAHDCDRSTCHPVFVNVIFSGNSARRGGGGYFITFGNDGPVFVNTTFSNNAASEQGGGIVLVDIEKPYFENVIFWGNIAPVGSQIQNNNFYDDWTPTFTNSIVQGSGGSDNWNGSLGIDGGNNLDQDPLFADAGNHILTLQPNSPAINTGTNAALPADIVDLDEDGDISEPIPIDIAGNVRIFDGTVDIGAYESIINNPIFLFLPFVLNN
ncbi:MAG: hypothetical protein KC413_02930, partial [Anaerolineales bacterium]|nr:hypothetical protein [Anaerolineales bacterium]